MHRLSIFLTASALILSACAGAQDIPPTPKAQPPAIDFGTATTIHPEIWPKGQSGLAQDPQVEVRVQKILRKMTLEEKVGQVIQADISTITPTEIKQYHIGSVLNGASDHPYGKARALPSDWLKLADELYAASTHVAEGRPAIPLIWGTDSVHGNTNVIGATIFPHNIGLGAMHDPALMEKIGDVTATEMRVTGSDWDFAPTIAVARNTRWGRTYESYSENPALVAEYAKAIVTGIQGMPGTANFLRGPHIIATVKHFLGDGGTRNGHDQGDNVYSEKALRDIFAPPYEAAISAGVQSVMASFSSWRGHKMHGDKSFLTDILRDRMGFDGFVVGDWNGHAQPEGCTRVDCPRAINAGLDMYMAPDGWKKLFENTLAEVKSGAIPEARLDQAVARILRVKIRAGVLDEGKPSARPFAGQFNLLGSAEHRAIARQAVAESLVLLKNNHHTLPLNPTGHILVAGESANDMTMQSGGWTISWQGTGHARDEFPHATTIFEGIRDNMAAAGGTATLSVDGSYTQKPDAVIVVFGESPYAEYRGDRPDADFAGQDEKNIALLQKFKAAGIPVVAMFLSGRPLYVTPEINAADAFVAGWLPGGEGEGVADVLFADKSGSVVHDFRGKLSFSWPRYPDQVRLNFDEEPYFPLFSYGYGLSYTMDRETGDLPLAAKGDVASANVDVLMEAGHASSGWALFATDGTGKSVKIDQPKLSAPAGLEISRADRRIQEDTLHLVWTAKGRAHLRLVGKAANFTHQKKQNMAVKLELRVNTAPTGKTLLGMTGAKNGYIDIAPRLKGLSGKGWHTLYVRLSCLEKAGTDMSAVSAPLDIVTPGALDLSLYAARLDSLPEGAGKTKACVITGTP